MRSAGPVEALAASSTEVTGAEPEEADAESTDGLGVPLVFGPVPGPKTYQNRIHPDPAPDTERCQSDRGAGFLHMGARRIDIGRRDVPWVAMADPKGNEFCVLSPR